MFSLTHSLSLCTTTRRTPQNYPYPTQHHSISWQQYVLFPYSCLQLMSLVPVGVYSSGPVWGRFVDTRGPRVPLACAFLLLLSGYSGIRHFFDGGIPDSATTLATFKYCLLVLCSYMTGAGGNGGLTSSVNSTAKTFPDRAVRQSRTSFHTTPLTYVP